MPPKPTVVKTNNRKDSIAEAKIKSVSFSELRSNYPNDTVLHKDPKTGKDIYANHCAIHVSDAMVKTGISMASFKGNKCEHCPRKNGTHARGAQELADWLRKMPFPGCPKPIVTVGASFEETFKGKKGIVFFKDYWLQEDEKGTKRRIGDHIDLWDDGTLASIGSFKSFFRINLGINIDGYWSDFTLSKEALLWEFK